MKRAFTPMLAALMLATAPMAASAAEEKVVYHVNDSANARVAMNNVNNHLNAAPDAKIVVVTHGKGIDFLLNDAKDDKGEFAPVIAGLKGKGVDFRVCANTLKARKLENSAVNADATIVASGVAEIGKLQAKEGFVYLKP
jgi:intracellular sulfur oxidation DsrE/DsrF family protein